MQDRSLAATVLDGLWLFFLSSRERRCEPHMLVPSSRTHPLCTSHCRLLRAHPQPPCILVTVANNGQPTLPRTTNKSTNHILLVEWVLLLFFLTLRHKISCGKTVLPTGSYFYFPRARRCLFWMQAFFAKPVCLPLLLPHVSDNGVEEARRFLQ